MEAFAFFKQVSNALFFKKLRSTAFNVKCKPRLAIKSRLIESLTKTHTSELNSEGLFQLYFIKVKIIEKIKKKHEGKDQIFKTFD